jgi:hypothetical protein
MIKVASTRSVVDQRRQSLQTSWIIAILRVTCFGDFSRSPLSTNPNQAPSYVLVHGHRTIAPLARSPERGVRGFVQGGCEAARRYLIGA